MLQANIDNKTKSETMEMKNEFNKDRKSNSEKHTHKLWDKKVITELKT